MPNYDFICEQCDYKDTVFLSISKRNVKRNCPKCLNLLTKCIGIGGGIIFKGNGFYETDYKQAGDYVKENDQMNKEREKQSKIDPDF